MDLITLTQALRNQIIENYYKYKNEFSKHSDESEENIDKVGIEDEVWNNEIENYDDDENEYYEELYSIYDEKVVLKVIDDIKNSGYKKLIHLIIIIDCLEFIKSREIKKRFISDSEKYLLILLENFNTKKLLNIINTDDDFLLNIMVIFLEYNITCTKEEKYENRLILKKQKIKISKQFKLSILDDIQQFYDKEK